VLIPTSQIAGQIKPLELEELVNKIEFGTLPDLTAEIKRRGVNFVFTSAVRRRVEEAVIKYHPSTRNEKKQDGTGEKDDYEELNASLLEQEPKDLLVAVAEFRSGNDNDTVELQTAIERRLRELGAPKNFIRIRPLLVSKERSSEISTENDAYKAGDELGVNLVVWGRWERSDPRGSAIVHPRLRVVHTHKQIGLREGQGRQADYKLEPLAHGGDISIIESGAIRTSNLIEILIAISYYERKDYVQAVRILEKIQTRDSDVYFYLGNCSYINGKYQEAEDFYHEAVRADGNSLKAMHNLATAQYRAGKLDQAIANFKRALEIDPASDKTFNNLGSLLVETERFDTGIGYIEQAINKNPNNAFAHYNYAAALYNRRRYKEAFEAFTEYLKLPEYMGLRPEEDHRTWSLCAELLRRNSLTYSPENLEQARTFLLKAIRYGPTEGSYLASYLRNIPLRVDQKVLAEELRLHRTWLDHLANDQFGDGLKKEDARKALLARIVYLLVKLGRFEDAHEAFSELGIHDEDLRDCQSRLVHELISGEIISGPPGRSLFTKKYYETIYVHFFNRNSFGTLPEANRGDLLDAYNMLLRSTPDHLGCLIGKGVLILEKLRFEERPQSKRGIGKQHEDSSAAWIRLANEALITLQRALTRANPTLKRDLKECIDTLRRL